MSRELFDRLLTLPGAAALVELAGDAGEADLVGGALRDLLLQRTPRELDVVVDGDPSDLAHALAARFQTEARFHDRFRTALVEAGDVRIDLASRRTETYASPGALPEVGPGGRDEDLRRRDFTINAVSLPLTDGPSPELHAVEHSFADLEHRRLRVLHDQSFIDDPTRLWRMGRYAARLGLTIEQHTAELAEQAIRAGAPGTVSGARTGAELRLALGEAEPLQSLVELERLGVLASVHPRLRVDPVLIDASLALLPKEGSRELLLLACITLPLILRAQGDPRVELTSLLDRLEFPRLDREVVLDAALAAPRLIDELWGARSISALHALASRVPVEAIALAGGLAAGRASELSAAQGDPVGLWLGTVRHVHLQITGEDLLAAGVSPGPEIGERLRIALRRRLDGEIEAGREAELQAALDAQL